MQKRESGCQSGLSRGWMSILFLFVLLFCFDTPAFADPAVVRLKPKVRSAPIEASPSVEYQTISLRSLRPDLQESIIFQQKIHYLEAPCVMAEDHHYSIAGDCNLLFVRNLEACARCDAAYKIFRPGKCYIDPCTFEFLGFEAINNGIAKVTCFGNCQCPSQMQVLKAFEAIQSKDRVFPEYVSGLPDDLMTQPAQACKTGVILSVRDDYTQMGSNQVVAVNLGVREGLRVGDVLEIYRNDWAPPKWNALVPRGWCPITDSCCRTYSLVDRCDERPWPIQLPCQRLGCVVIYQTAEKMSLGLILKAKGEIKLFDLVQNPG